MYICYFPAMSRESVCTVSRAWLPQCSSLSNAISSKIFWVYWGGVRPEDVDNFDFARWAIFGTYRYSFVFLWFMSFKIQLDVFSIIILRTSSFAAQATFIFHYLMVQYYPWKIANIHFFKDEIVIITSIIRYALSAESAPLMKRKYK